MKQSRIAEIDRLYQDVRSYKSTEEFSELMHFIRKFRYIAPYNAMLIHIQKPGSSFVATVKDWKNKYNRTIKPGARPLIILQQFGPVAFVYEYNDTEGEPLPDYLVRPFKTNEVIRRGELNYFINNLKAEGIDTYCRDFGTDFAGQIQRNEDERILEIQSSSKKYLIISYHTIVYNVNLSDTEVFATILHELGHLYCGHLYHDSAKEKWLPARFDIGLTGEQMEFEAETVCWLVCERMGIKNPSAEYLSEYMKDNKEIPDVSIDAILKAVNIIEGLIKGTRHIRRELILKTEE